MTQNDTDTQIDAETLTDRLFAIVGQSGLLFQEHPDVDGWETTRPGAYSGEVMAFKNEQVEPGFARLSLCFFEAGETDEDGYEYIQDAYVLETMDRALEVPKADLPAGLTEYVWEPEQYPDLRGALERIAAIMLDVADRPRADEEAGR